MRGVATMKKPAYAASYGPDEMFWELYRMLVRVLNWLFRIMLGIFDPGGWG